MSILSESELIINEDGSIFHLHLKPEQLSDRIILCGDPERVSMIAEYFDDKECDVYNREFHTITGMYQEKRVSVVSTGIGCDNIDIVLNELDALANIDFSTRTIHPVLKQLTLVRIGTSGGMQPFVPIGSYVAAEKSIGFDGVLYFYKDHEKIRDLAIEDALIHQLEWNIAGVRPYVVTADSTLTNQIVKDDIVQGMTIAANGFYGPQGRELRLPLADERLNKKIIDFQYHNRRITNFEMESSALAGLAALLGHRALTVCYIIAGRYNKNMNIRYKESLPQLIKKILDRI